MRLGKDFYTGAKRAREARERYGLSPLGPLSCLLEVVEEAAGLQVMVVPLPDGVAGVCWGAASVKPLLLVNAAQPAVRQRFTLAHELGHVCCGHGNDLPRDSFATTLREGWSDPRERQANAFAGEFLMPKASAEDLLGDEPSLDEIVVFAAHHGVSAHAATIRARTAGRLDAGYEAMWERLGAREHGEAWDRLGCREIDDRVARLREPGALPHFSPSLRGGALAAVLAGDASVEAAAARTGLDPVGLRELVRALTRP